MIEKISSKWWVFALRGLVAVIFGVLALIWNEQTLQALVTVFGAFALVNGIMTMYAGISSAAYFERWWVLLLEGIVGVIVGLIAIFNPDITTRALMYLIGAWAIITGILEIVAAIKIRDVIEGEWMLILGGLLSIFIGILMFVYPETGAKSLIGVVAIFAILYGISEIVFAFRLHSTQKQLEEKAAE